MLPTRDELVDLYRKRARRYDLTANLYYLIGFREWSYRKRAVEALELAAGDRVVEIGCGTGLNLPLLRRAVGSRGEVIAVDLNDAMLARARARVARKGWSNVELVQSDAARFAFPAGIRGVISTFAITLVPEYDEVIRQGVRALVPGGRFAILDFKRAEWAPLWLVKALVAITAPFGVSLEMAEHHPWESLDRHGERFRMRALYSGFAYLAVAEAASSARRDT